jgi:tRNA(Ile2)-agmatinylcytidine synthase
LVGYADSCRVWIGLDDTDNPDSGCTTATFDDLLGKISQLDNFEIIERRLVRLWPFAERRTRGNGALACILKCPKSSINILEELLSNFFSQLVIELKIEENSLTSPALIYTLKELNEDFYWEAVRHKVDLDKRRNSLDGVNILSLENSDWGIIGASSAMAWNPSDDSTWELISWRFPELIGTQRKVTSSRVKEMELLHPETFVNRDPTADKGLIAPRTPCPVLYGIRGSNSQVVLSAHLWLQSQSDVEKCERYAIHRTNQLSDDHILGFSTATVLTKPVETKGAHSALEVFSNGRNITLVAFKEGGDVNRLLRKLIPGDRINWLGLESPDGSIHLERLSIESSLPRITGRPTCCNGKTMRSAGSKQPLRCLNCQKVSKKYWLYDEIDLSGIELTNNWVEPSASQRRHLSKPLILGAPTSSGKN